MGVGVIVLARGSHRRYQRRDFASTIRIDLLGFQIDLLCQLNFAATTRALRQGRSATLGLARADACSPYGESRFSAESFADAALPYSVN